MNLTEIGFTKEELQERLIERISSELLETVFHDEQGDESSSSSQFKRKLQAEIMKRIDAKIGELAEKHVLPNVSTWDHHLNP